MPKEALCVKREILFKDKYFEGFLPKEEFDFISINPDTMQAINNKSLSENIYVLGGLTQGTYIASNLMESIVELSQNIIRNIIQT